MSLHFNLLASDLPFEVGGKALGVGLVGVESSLERPRVLRLRHSYPIALDYIALFGVVGPLSLIFPHPSQRAHTRIV
jgi:hypothetical protein